MAKSNRLIQQIYNFIIFMFIIIFQIRSQFCNGKVYNDDQVIPLRDIERICTDTSKSPEFIVRIMKQSPSLLTNNVILQSSSERFFKLKCAEFTNALSNMCEDGFLIDLYTEEKLIIIHPGTQSSISVDSLYRERVLESMSNNLLKNEYSIALIKAIKLLNYKEKGGDVKLKSSENTDPHHYIWAIILPALVIIFLFLILLLFFGEKGIINKQLFNYLDTILLLWQKIENSNDKQIILDPSTCLLCLRPGTEKLASFLYCNHSYHHLCMYKWGQHISRSCPCSFEAVEGDEHSTINSSRPPYLNIDDIKNLLGFMLDAYRKENAYDYFVEKEMKINDFNETYNVNLEDMCWIYSNKLENYRKFRIFWKIWRALKLMCCAISFYPSKYINSKKGNLIRQLLMVQSSGSSVGKFK